MKKYLNNNLAATNLLCNWITNHLDKFRPSGGEGLNSLSGLKPMFEFILVLYSFSGQGRNKWHPLFTEWVRETATSLQRTLEELEKSIDWADLPGLIQSRPVTGAALFAFPAVEAITGVPVNCSSQVISALACTDFESSRATIPVLFASDIAGTYDCSKDAIRLTFSTIDSGENESLSTSAIYLVTHFLFYATKMGQRQVALEPLGNEQLKKYLEASAQRSIKKRNYDLLSEILMCMSWMGYKRSIYYRKGIAMIINIVIEKGYCPGYNSRSYIQNESFATVYHPTLTALSAIIHAS